MPYKRIGVTVYKLDDGRWIVVKKHPTVDAAKKHLAALNIHVMAEEKK